MIVQWGEKTLFFYFPLYLLFQKSIYSIRIKQHHTKLSLSYVKLIHIPTHLFCRRDIIGQPTGWKLGLCIGDNILKRNSGNSFTKIREIHLLSASEGLMLTWHIQLLALLIWVLAPLVILLKKHLWMSREGLCQRNACSCPIYFLSSMLQARPLTPSRTLTPSVTWNCRYRGIACLPCSRGRRWHTGDGGNTWGSMDLICR